MAGRGSIIVKKIAKIIVIILVILVLLFGAFSAFVLLGKDKALNLEVNSINLDEIQDGVYTGSYSGFRWSNTVEVTVKNHQITDIKVKKSQVFITPETTSELIERIKLSQNTKVDVVTGATADSNAFMKAVENALKKQ
jgi:uncharacterized protein with FMN-binding domain